MSSNPGCSVFIGNLDERVTDRILYDILIQAGRIVDLYIPRDKETDRPKGFAFAEYETEEIADYAVKLFSGLVTIYSRTLRFAISGQAKPTSNLATSNSALKSKSHSIPTNIADVSPSSTFSSTSRLFSAHQLNHERVPISPGSGHQYSVDRSRMDHSIHDFRRGFGATWDGNAHSRSSRHDTSNLISYGPY